MCLIHRGRSRAQTRMRQLSAIASADRINATRQDANRYTQRHPYSRATASVLSYTREHISCRFWSAEAHENTKAKHSVVVIIITQSIRCNIHITYYILYYLFAFSFLFRIFILLHRSSDEKTNTWIDVHVDFGSLEIHVFILKKLKENFS